MYSKFILMILTIILSSISFLKSAPDEKQEFIYKTVKDHEIKANIFLPELLGEKYGKAVLKCQRGISG